ncbi:MAG: SDR family oxidoreductase [Candidatus Abyssobacteria bacterium SURF_5]|uniref:SDR family oxidoreductase n=1 Tax=Abyssobacteria bacterium (strain SURF_5) TaxID=2093360 RepID=A0A3A4NLV4_ABYX5|nr:MAG: SDR family oxidoreductase [Candidatus Abyssubacteria bacterium SURF_5]
MDLYLKNKVALVTGAGSGIGRNTALFLAEEGAKVCCADLFEEKVAETVKMIRDQGGEAMPAVCDVREYRQVTRMLRATLNAYAQVDMLINSAGVAAGGLFADTEPEEWASEININLIGTMNCCRAVIDHMIPRGYGKIVNLASDAGRVGEKRMTVYGAAKGGVIGFTKCLAVEMARFKINVNAVAPGVVRSPMTSYLTDEMAKEWARYYPLRRLGETEDIANMIVFLCSDRTNWMTGQIVSVDGGFSRV